MHGLNDDDLKSLTLLCGEVVVQVAVGESQIQFATSPKAIGISIEGKCELWGPDHQLIDTWDRGKRSGEFRFFELIGRRIQDVIIDSPRSFVATFDHGFKLRVIDDSDQYESFSVGTLYV